MLGFPDHGDRIDWLAAVVQGGQASVELSVQRAGEVLGGEVEADVLERIWSGCGCGEEGLFVGMPLVIRGELVEWRGDSAGRGSRVGAPVAGQLVQEAGESVCLRSDCLGLARKVFG
ncbi:hypothetical protein WEB32_30295 [Streptomyces netropsis]